MVDMYVLVVCDLLHTAEIISKLRTLDGVEEVHMLNGVYDILVNISATSLEGLEHVYSKIRQIPGIRTTLTLVGYTK